MPLVSTGIHWYSPAWDRVCNRYILQMNVYRWISFWRLGKEYSSFVAFFTVIWVKMIRKWKAVPKGIAAKKCESCRSVYPSFQIESMVSHLTHPGELFKIHLNPWRDSGEYFQPIWMGYDGIHPCRSEWQPARDSFQNGHRACRTQRRNAHCTPRVATRLSWSNPRHPTGHRNGGPVSAGHRNHCEFYIYIL